MNNHYINRVKTKNIWNFHLHYLNFKILYAGNGNKIPFTFLFLLFLFISPITNLQAQYATCTREGWCRHKVELTNNSCTTVRVFCREDGCGGREYDMGTVSPGQNKAWLPSAYDAVFRLTVNGQTVKTFPALDADGTCKVYRFSYSNTDLNANISKSNNISCDKTSATLTANPSGQRYRWSNGSTNRTITVSSSGTYRVTVTNSAGCSDDASVSVSQNTSKPDASISKSNNISCDKTSATLTANPSGQRYRWSNGSTNRTITVSSSGTYRVTVTNSAGCSDDASVSVSGDTNEPTILVSKSNDLSCDNNTTTLTATTNGGTVQWSTGQTGTSIQISLAGTYTATIRASNGCTASRSITVSGDTNQPTININKSNDLSCNQSSATLTATTNGGTVRWSTGQTGNSITVSSANTYTATVTATNGCTTSATIIVTGGCNPTASVGNEVFNDANGNGFKDAGEQGISGVLVKLLDSNSNEISSTTTNGSGQYNFGNLPSGSYKIMFGTPNGFSPSPQTGFGDNDTDNNSDNNPNNNNMTDLFFLSSGENNPTIDAGFRPNIPTNTARVGNQVFNDANNNGFKDNNESGINGVEVKLLDANGNFITSTTTTNNGTYFFNNLAEGSYKIMFGTPNGFLASPRTGFGDNDTDNNSDNNPNNGNMTDVFFLSSGENNPTIDAGFFAGTMCDNLNFGGKIGFGNTCAGSTESCNNIDAPQIGSCNLPSGGSGAIEYIWLKNEVSCNGPTGTVAQMLANPDAYNWKIIFNSNSPTFNPGILSTSTCFLRCARRVGCDLYLGESNIVRIDVNDCNGGNTGGGTTETCGGGTSIIYGNGSITMTGGSFYQVFDKNWKEVFNCGWQCGNTQTASGLPAGEFRVHIKDSNYQVICEKVITLSTGGTDGGNSGGTDGGNTGGTTESCGGGTSITYGAGSITMKGGSFYQVLDNNWNEVFNCGWECGNSQTADGLPVGTYRIYIKGSNYQVICEKVITLSTGGTDGGNTGGTGGGNTGGTSDSTTCGEVTITYGDGIVNMIGQSGKDYYFKINDLNNGWAQAFGCGWDCGHQQMANNLPNSKYLITIHNSDWSKHCDIEIEMTNSSYSGSVGSRNAPQLDFSAFQAERTVELQWLTNSGYKVERFEIERSLDGHIFNSLEQTINKDWSTDLAYHQTIDSQPNTGVNYYRVKEIYLDGSFKYTAIQRVGFHIDLDKVTVFPNPAKNELFINLKPYVSNKGVLTMTNQFGQTVQQINLAEINKDLLQINTERLTNGLYFLNVQLDNQRIFTEKVMIHRLY